MFPSLFFVLFQLIAIIIGPPCFFRGRRVRALYSLLFVDEIYPLSDKKNKWQDQSPHYQDRGRSTSPLSWTKHFVSADIFLLSGRQKKVSSGQKKLSSGQEKTVVRTEKTVVRTRFFVQRTKSYPQDGSTCGTEEVLFLNTTRQTALATATHKRRYGSDHLRYYLLSIYSFYT